ncbi:MAG: NHL repeat-containing protein [Myxococcota bacterium]|nr:NHL repeat-containing protein [Myxococcota bacterium]
MAYTFVSRFGSALQPDPGVLNLPSGITVNSNTGDVFVANTIFRQIQRFDAEGNHLTSWDSLPAMGITVDHNDNTVLVALPGKGKLIRYSADGEELGEIGGEMEFPVDATVRTGDGRIFVLNRTGHIDVFSRDGKHLANWYGGAENPVGDSSRPANRNYGLSMAPDGQSIYVSNSGRAHISQFDLEGNPIRNWGSGRSSEPGRMRWNRGMAVAENGNVIIADTDNERLQMFSATGEHIAAFRGPHDLDMGTFHSRAVAVNVKTGIIYATASYSHRVDRFTPDGEYIATFGKKHDDPMVLNEPRGLTVDPSTGNIFITDKRDHIIKRYSKDGEFQTSFRMSPGDLSGVDISWNTQAYYQFPAPIEMGLDGTLWMIRQGFHYPDDPTPSHYLRQYDLEGNFLQGVESEEMAGYMTGIDIHAQTRDFYITSSKVKGILHLAADGSHIKTWQPEEALQDPSGIAIDESRQRAYVLDVDASRVRVFDLSGNPLGSWGSKGKKHGEFRLSVPGGIKVDECGLVYVADHSNRRVQVFTPEGELAAYFRMQGEKSKKPWNIHILGDQILVLSDEGVERYRREGGCDR